MPNAARKIPEDLRLPFLEYLADIADERRARQAGKGRPWTTRDIAILVALRETGKTFREIARILNRTDKACRRIWEGSTKGKKNAPERQLRSVER